MKKPNIGVIGLAVMGANLARNIESRGYACAVFNRSGSVTDKFMEENQGKNFIPSKTISEFISSIEKPRRIIVMVKAGKPMDEIIESVSPQLSRGDVLMDGGNAYYKDTIKREKLCAEFGIHYMGVGISGGEEGALKGPSIMPGGTFEGWSLVSEILQSISAKVNGEPCAQYIGPNGSGHFVKMIHNGIEYGDMQLIAEIYDLLKRVGGFSPEEISGIFNEWNKGVLSSYLIEITGKIFQHRDKKTGGYLIDKILDKAGQKGTGKWTIQDALDLGVSIPTIAGAVDARVLSSLKEERVSASKLFSEPQNKPNISDKTAFINSLHDALYCSKIISYAQGMSVLSVASKEYGWGLKLDTVTSLWRGGCIIRARLLDLIMKAFRDEPELKNLMLYSEVRAELERCISGLRRTVSISAEAGIPAFGLSASLSYFDSYRAHTLPQNLTQGQRDFFGSHTFERVDEKGIFHEEWQGGSSTD